MAGRLGTGLATVAAVALLTIVGSATRSPGSAVARLRNTAYAVSVDPFAQQAELTSTHDSTDASAGYSVAVSGNTVAVGVPNQTVSGHAHQGAVYIYTMPKGGWANMTTPRAVLTASDGAANDQLGYSVAISGNTVLAGAPHHKSGSTTSGVAYVFEKPAAGWANTSTFNAELIPYDAQSEEKFGWSVALSADAAVVGAAFQPVNGNPDVGTAYVFQEPATGWATTEVSAELSSDNGLRGISGRTLSRAPSTSTPSPHPGGTSCSSPRRS